MTRRKYELFDLSVDPHEKTDVSAAHAPEFEALSKELDDWLAQQSVHARRLPHIGGADEQMDRMRALGYM